MALRTTATAATASTPAADPEAIPARASTSPAGRWTMIFLVAVALGVSWLEAGPSRAFAVESSLAVGLALAWMVGVGERLQRDSPAAWRIAYFVLQLALFAVVAAVFVRHRTFGVSWLFYMPVITLARMLLPALGTLTVCLASLGLVALHIEALVGWDDVLHSLLPISTAVVFVLLLTDIALRERTARADAQRLSRELEQANRRLGEYAVQAEELATARERARMAREIHDSVGHSLTAVHMQIEAARTMLEREPETARDALGKAQNCVKDGLDAIRRSVSSLRADALEGRELGAALDSLAREASSAGAPVQVHVEGTPRPLPPAVALTLYRCAQEGLTNTRKHARARRVDIVLRYGPRVSLRVDDDGVGADPSLSAPDLDAPLDSPPDTPTPGGGFGLLGLRERAHQLDGTLDIVTRPGAGFSLRLELPVATSGAAS